MYSFPSSSRNTTSPLSPKAPLTAQDRDAQAQRALLGETAYLEETESPSSPLNTPSPMVDGMSPLSVASHLQDACDPFQVRDVNPFLDGSWITRTLNEADLRLSPNTSSPKRQIWSVPVTPEPSSAMLLPTIQEAAPSPPPALPPRPKATPMNATRTYTLPSTSLATASSSSSSTFQMRRRPSPFPLGPVPAPPPQRRARYEPRPHIVDLATEQFGLKTTTISTAAITQLQQERERQWQLWESERIRSLEMTREAAKNNRVQAPSRSPSAVVLQEKPVAAAAAPAVVAPVKKVSKSKWWCFGGGAVESDNEEINEKEPVRSASRLSTVSGLSEDDDEEEWNEARASTGITGLLGFGCASRKKAGASRPRATLKKRVQ